MKGIRFALITLCLVWFEPTLAQFNRPHQVAYNAADKKFVVSNRDAGEVLTLDASKSVKKVITGLTRPRGIFFGSIAGNSAIAILDSNLIRLYNPSTYNSFINLTVPDALGLEDAVIHPTNSNIIFLTDPESGRIIKATIGSPPFYPVTFTTFNNDVPMPNALMINHKGQLLVAADTADGGIYSINLTNGKETLVKALNMDNVNSMVQDGQNNYYLSNWSDDYVYRFNSNLSDSVQVTAYADPSGMIYHAPTDELVIACSGCNKVDFIKLHQFELDGGFQGCPGDEFEVYQSFWFKSVGTFEKNNSFILELSDPQGSFASAIRLDKQDTTEFPGSFSGVIPEKTSSASRLIRVRSTQPSITSKPVAVKIFKAPERPTFTPTNYQGCEGDTMFIGRLVQQDVEYSWWSNAALSDTTSSNPWVVLKGISPAKAFGVATDTVTGCTTSDSIQITINQLPLIIFPDTFLQCGEDTLRFPSQTAYKGSYRINGFPVGIDGFPAFWTSGYEMDTTLYFHFVSHENSCTVKDTATYIYRSDISMPVVTLNRCETDTSSILLRNSHVSGGVEYTGVWSSPVFIIRYSPNQDTVEFGFPGKAGTFSAFGQINAEGCLYKGSITVQADAIPQFDEVAIGYSLDSVFAELAGAQGDYFVTWYQNTNEAGTGSKIGLQKATQVLPGDSLRAVIVNGRCTDTTEWIQVDYSTISVGQEINPQFRVYPNPTHGLINLPKIELVKAVQIIDTKGTSISLPIAETVDLGSFQISSGIYWLKVVTSDGVFRSRVVVSRDER